MSGKKALICTLFALALLLSGCSEEEKPPESPQYSGAELDVDPDSTEISIILSEGETELLSGLSKLESADFSGSECIEEIYDWAARNPQVDVKYTVTLPDGTVLDNSAKRADLSSMDGDDVCAAAESLRFLPKLMSIDLGEERSSLGWTDIEALQKSCPDATIRYRFTLYGKETDLQNTQLNLSHIPISDKAESLRQAMDHMPHLSYVDMDSCGISNEDMAQLRDDYPDVKIVWRVWFGSDNKYSVRTDTERILASKPSVAGFIYDYYADPLKYCTDVKYLDLGHNAPLADISFVEYMPNLEVAILAMAAWSDASPLASCKELEYLEMQTTECTDLSPLSGLENLRHLNVACIPGLVDISPLYSLTKLERLWLGSNNNVPTEQVEAMQKAAPDCEINAAVYEDPTGDGWRYRGYNMVFRYYILRKQFDNYSDSAFSFWWNDPLY